MSDPALSTPSDDAAIFSINADDDSDFNTEDPQFPLPGGHRHTRRPDPGDKPMNDPFPPMYLNRPPKRVGGHLATTEPRGQYVKTPGADQLQGN